MSSRNAWYGILGLCLGVLQANCFATHAYSPTKEFALPDHARLLPSRVRRLSNIEYERSANELVGMSLNIAERLPPDVRQQGYTLNVEQSAPPAWTARLDTLARDIARRAVSERLHTLAPCSASPSRACAERTVSDLATRAWRRPVDASEIATLMRAFDAGARAGSSGFATGIELVLTALLESPSFLYLTEFGQGGSVGSVVELEPYEIASLLSYSVRGGPPDGELLAAAAVGTLSAPDEREKHARRLISLSDTRHHFRRFILEWLEVDNLENTVKDAKAFPDYEQLRPRMLAETQAFVDEVMVTEGASLRALLNGGFASVDPELARFYGLRTWGARASLARTRRAGLLQQASFLSAHAHEDATSPVKRGDFVLRRLLCHVLPRPAEIGLEVSIPPPSSTNTTRERFSAHVQNGSCSGCHARIDAIGFAFEGFDAMGRTRTIENGKPIVSADRAKIASDTLSFKDSLDLTQQLAEAPEVSECFARQAFRYFTGQSEPEVERTFVALLGSLEAKRRDNLLEALIAYVRSDLFIKREVRLQ